MRAARRSRLKSEECDEVLTRSALRHLYSRDPTGPQIALHRKHSILRSAPHSLMVSEVSVCVR